MGIREAVAGEFGLLVLAMCVGLFAAGIALGVGSRSPPARAERARAGGHRPGRRGVRGQRCWPSPRWRSATAASAAPSRTAWTTSPATPRRRLAAPAWARCRALAAPTGSRAGTRSRSGPWRARAPARSHWPASSTWTAASRRATRTATWRRRWPTSGSWGWRSCLALLAAWLAAAARATGLRPRGRPRPDWDGDRAAICALALCVVVFGVHSLLDWIWFVPGPTVTALVAAGFVAGLGPLRRAGTAPAGASGEPSPATGPGTARIVAAAAVLVTAVLCAVRGVAARARTTGHRRRAGRAGSRRPGRGR